MKITVLGCGEAFDDRYVNTSLLVDASGSTVLMDCGYSVPPQLWRAVPDASAIDVIYISHAHADHYFGMPAVLGRMWEEQRKKPLVIMGQPSVLDHVRQAMEFGYTGLASRFKYKVEYLPVQPGRTCEWKQLSFDFAPTRHAVSNLAVRVRAGEKTFCYSGDGTLTDESRRLFSRADLVVHEAYLFEPLPIHADIPGLLEMAGAEGVRQLAFVHVQRALRAKPDRIHEAMAAFTAAKVTMPEPLAVYEV
jgi:ribonuclease BN (tRNA processing enzyme)